MAVRPLRGLALCAGAGGFELGLSLALGDAYRTVGYVERDAYAAAALVARMADQALDDAPVWDDLGTFDGRPWRGAVDIVAAGFPCPPFSSAGKRRGTDDTRWIWPLIGGVVRDVAPRFVFLENVPGLLVPAAGQLAGIGHVLRDLAALGFDAEWERLSAADCTAPHLRKRVFILAYRHGCRLPGPWLPDGPRYEGSDAERARPALADTGRSGGPAVAGGPPGHEGGDGWRAAVGGHQPDGDDEALAHALGGGGLQRAGRAHDEGRFVQPKDRSRPLADPISTRRPGERAEPVGAQLPDVGGGRSGLPLWPPGPDDHDGWRRLLATDPGLEPSVRRDADGLAGRLERLRTVGNGVVPLVAAAAFLRLARRAGLV